MRRLRIALVLAVFAAGALAAGSAGAAEEPAAHFADVDRETWFTTAVDWGQTAGVVTGVAPECFLPDRTATRAEVAATFQRLLAPDATSTAHPYVDVTADWQQAPIAFMHDEEITTGTSPTTFGPDGPATRAMIAAFVWRAEGRPGVGSITNPFTDVLKGWQVVPVEWMWQNDLTTGRAPTSFAPDEPVTRAELLTFLWRWQGEPGPLEELAAPEPVDCLVRTRTCADVFRPGAVVAIVGVANSRNVTAHVHDHRTDCVYELHPDLTVTTASVIKAQVLAGVLLDAQERGEPVSEADAARIELMMHYSHNSPPTSELYVAVGGASGMAALDDRFGLTDTGHTARYGATTSTAADRTRLVEQLLVGGGPLDAAHVEQAWEWMSADAVTPVQTWGITKGLPADHEVALKNGFYPMFGRGWRLGSSGVIRTPDGGTIAVTIMTEYNDDETSGIELVELVARHINEELTLGDPAPRAVDDVTCTVAAFGDTWDDAATALGGADPAEVRLLNGGEDGPLSGQRICIP